MGSGIGMLGMNCRFLGLVAGDELWDAGIGQPQIPGDGGTYSDRLQIFDHIQPSENKVFLTPKSSKFCVKCSIFQPV